MIGWRALPAEIRSPAALPERQEAHKVKKMLNGKIHDNPITDITVHDLHPLPKEMEKLILQIDALNPSAFSDLGWEPFAWEKGENVEEVTNKFDKHLIKLDRSDYVA